MILKLTDRTEFTITQEQADKISEELKTNSTDNQFIFVNGQALKKTMIAGIFPGPDPAKPQVPSNAPKIAARPGGAGSTCQAQHSIQWAIHQYTVKHYPRDWARRVKNKKWREKIRQLLRDADPSKKWCDYKAGECACETGKGSDVARQHLNNIRKIFAEKDAQKGIIT